MKRAAPYGTLSVFTYKSRIVARLVPRSELPAVAHAVLAGLFGPQRDSMFSLTIVDSGCFFLYDESLSVAFDGVLGSGLQRYCCLYIHEGSESVRGSESAGTLAALSARLAREALPVLNITTVERNFLLVHEHHADKALSTLQRAIESGVVDDTADAGAWYVAL